MRKALIIFIEGQDRSGKTSLISPIFKNTGWVHNVIDRGPLSNYVYSKQNNRDIDLNSYLELLKNKYIITIYLNTSIEAIIERTISSNDYNVPLDKIEEHKKDWLAAYDKIKQYSNTFEVDNSKLSIEQTIEKIENIIYTYEESLV